MGENKINLVGIFVGKLVPKPSNSGTRVDGNDITAFGADFQTGGIAAVFQIPPARNRDGAPGSPACDLHLGPFNGGFFLKRKLLLPFQKQPRKLEIGKAQMFIFLLSRVCILSCFRNNRVS